MSSSQNSRGISDMSKAPIKSLETKGILVNRLDYHLNEPKFDGKYTILHAEFRTYDQRKGAVDHLSSFGTIRAIRYGGDGTSFYIMLNGSTEKLKICEKMEREAHCDSISQEKCGRVKPDILLDLMMIGLNSDPDIADEPSFSNIEGSVYTFEPSGVKEDRIITFNPNIREAKDCRELFGDVSMRFPAKSFPFEEKLKIDKRDAALLPKLSRYEVDGNRLRYSRNNSTQVKRCVGHGYHGMKKASIPFIGLSDVKHLDESKMGRVRKTLRKMMRVYADVDLEIGFVRTDLFDGNHYYQAKDSRYDVFLEGMWSGKTIYLTDMVGSDSSKAIVRGFSTDLNNLFGIEVDVVDDIVRGGPNIVLIKNKRNDPDYKSYPDEVVQHISVENFAKYYYREKRNEQMELFEKIENSSKVPSDRRNSLYVVLSDLIIKTDVLNSTRHVVDWYLNDRSVSDSAHPLDRKWCFYNRTRTVSNDPVTKKRKTVFNDVMSCMEVDTDGLTTYRLIGKDELYDFHTMLIWDQFNEKQLDIHGVMSDGVNTYVFLETDVLMLPETDQIRDKLLENAKAHELDEKHTISGGIRNRGLFELYLKGCTDIRFYHHRYDCLYIVGVKGYNIKSSIHWATNVHRIAAVEGDERVPDSVFDMMFVPFVKRNQYTKLPFPFKFLHEFERIHSFEDIYLDEEDGTEEDAESVESIQSSLDAFLV